MSKQTISRRGFARASATGIGSAWLLANMPEVALAQAHAHQAAQAATPLKFEYFTPAQATEVEAIAAQIIPTDDTPGAREARVIYFIDRALATFAADQRPVFIKGLKQLQTDVGKQVRGKSSFAALNSEQQIALLKKIEKSDFFEAVRNMTIFGMFADPSYGGNHDKLGWKLLGFDDKFDYEPPFGFYDSDQNRER